MAQPIRQHDTNFDLEEDPSVQLAEQIKLKSHRSFVIVVTIAIVVGLAAIFYVFGTINYVRDGLFYRYEIMSKDMLPFWQDLAAEEKKKDSTQLIEKGEHEITRQQLGRMGWTMLHMMTGSFPEEITPELRQKWNAFLILFGQFYPCKVCSQHFLQMLKSVEPFSGDSKEHLMKYLCELHNRVNRRLNKPMHNCDKVKNQWNTCGCNEGRLM